MTKDKCSESVQSRAEVYVLKACDACADMGHVVVVVVVVALHLCLCA